MKRKLFSFILPLLLSSLMVLPSYANSVATAEPIQLGKEYAFSYFCRIDDADGGWYYDSSHVYSYAPALTEEYTIEVKGSWLNDNTWIEVRDQSGRYVDSGNYNPYLKRVTSTAKLYSGQAYYLEVFAGGESSAPQVLTTSISKHVHEYEQKDYEKCIITGFSDGFIDAYDGGYTNWCRVCDHEEYVTLAVPQDVKISASKPTYNGKVQKPKVRITDGDGAAMTSYQVKYPSSKAPGRYQMTISFTGDYTGSIKVPYTIVPAKPGAPKLKAVKGGFNASWAKAGGAEGYQVTWSLDKSFLWTEGQKATKKSSFSLKSKYAPKSTLFILNQSHFVGILCLQQWPKRTSVPAIATMITPTSSGFPPSFCPRPSARLPVPRLLLWWQQRQLRLRRRLSSSPEMKSPA